MRNGAQTSTEDSTVCGHSPCRIERNNSSYPETGLGGEAPPLHRMGWGISYSARRSRRCWRTGCRERPMEVLELYLSLGYVPAPFSFFKHVRKLLPGHYLLVRDGVIQDHSYWELPAIDENNFRTDKHKIYKEFEELLIDSVPIRMRSDVPYRRLSERRIGLFERGLANVRH